MVRDDAALHETMWRGEVSRPNAERALQQLGVAPIAARRPRKLASLAWKLAEELGWAKTYDAEYLALAELLGSRVLTVDSHLRRGADRVGLVVLSSEL